MSLQREIPFDSPQHGRILTALKERYLASRNKMADRYQAWKTVEEHFRAYVPETEADAKRRWKRELGKPQYQTVFIPYSYAMTMAAHTYLSSVFLGRTPVLQYVGRSGQTEAQTQAVEALIDYQIQVGGMLVPLYVWLMDLLKYGLGIVGNYWAEESVAVRNIEKVPKTYMGMDLPDTSQIKHIYSRVEGYTGSKLYNISPYDFLPDPTVSLLNFQRGEFCGRRTVVGWNQVVRAEAEEEYFNVEHLKKSVKDHFEQTGRETSMNLELPEEEGEWKMTLDWKRQNDIPTKVRLWEMCVELSPEAWELGSEVWPEKWMFTVGEGAVIVGARPLGEVHGAFPYNVLSYEFDAYSHGVRGMPEVVGPLSNVLNWLFDSRMSAVRQNMNGKMVVDPSKLVMGDLDKPNGFIARLTPQAYGTDPKAVFAQITMADTTASHLQDGRILMEIFQWVTGVSVNLMGTTNPGRKTATEVRTAAGFGLNRLKTLAEFQSALGWSPLSQVLLQSSQQHYTAERVVRVVGDLARAGKSNMEMFLHVKPDDIAGFFDLVPVDGTMPVDRVAQAGLWKELLVAIASFPEIGLRYDIPAIFGWIAQLAGLRNITQFELGPDEQLAAMAQKGQLIGAGTAGAGGVSGPGPARTSRATVRPEAGAPILAGPSGVGPLV